MDISYLFFKKYKLKCKASPKYFFAYARNAVFCKQKLEESNTEAKESSLGPSWWSQNQERLS